MLCMASHQENQEEIKPKSMVTNTGYWYLDHQNQNQNQNQNMMESSFHEQNINPADQIYNLTSGMEMIGFPQPKINFHHHDMMWNKGNNFFNKTTTTTSTSGTGPSSSSKNGQFYEHGHGENMTMVTTTHDDHHPLLVDQDPSLRCVLFPCEGNERPSQGLSLSLCSSNPSSISLQSFELRHQQESNNMNVQQIIQDGFLGKVANHHHQQQQQGYYHQIRDSKYLSPAQELLNEFCSLGTKQNESLSKVQQKTNNNQWLDDENGVASTSKKQPLQSLDLLELQKRKTKLLQMLEEVDRRYKNYCDQMKAVVSSFEAVAGNGAAKVYSSLASRAMSRHFRCLRDGIVGQIKYTKKAMGEKDTNVVVPGTTRGETPRLRLLDQTLRQQKAFQQMNMMETHPWRPQRGLPERSVSVLRAWLFEHFLHPYPSDVDKHILARQTGLSRSQVSNWFINARVRLWKPMVEEMYLEETKEQENNLGLSPDGYKALDHHDHDHDMINGMITQNPHNNNIMDHQDQKPNLVRIDSECISSIINNNNNNNPHDKNDHQVHNLLQHHNYFGRPSGDHDHHQTSSFGAIELDFSSGGGGGSHGVSLTLGLNQHGGTSHGGMDLTFSSQAAQNSIFEDCQQVQYSLLDSENQNLPYRNLMGAQLLHDLAG